MELIVGCRDREELQKLNRFLRRYQTIEVNDSISGQAVKLVETYFP